MYIVTLSCQCTSCVDLSVVLEGSDALGQDGSCSLDVNGALAHMQLMLEPNTAPCLFVGPIVHRSRFGAPLNLLNSMQLCHAQASPAFKLADHV